MSSSLAHHKLDFHFAPSTWIRNVGWFGCALEGRDVEKDVVGSEQWDLEGCRYEAGLAWISIAPKGGAYVGDDQSLKLRCGFGRPKGDLRLSTLARASLTR